MKKGFTLTEILIAVILAGILASIAVPQLQEHIEKARANEAINYLRMIRTAQKMYYSKNAAYSNWENLDEMRDNLDVEVSDSHYDFTVRVTEDGFLITATRNDGSGNTITLDQDGTFGGKSKYTPQN